MSEHTITEMFFYRASDNDIMIVSMDKAQMEKLSMGAVGFERLGAIDLDLMARDELWWLLGFTGWEYIGEV